MRTKTIKYLLLVFCFGALPLYAQTYKGYYTEYCGDIELQQKAKEWVQAGLWAHGFNKAQPHSSVNVVNFYQQYQRNPEQWKALFDWLQSTDLLAIAPGKHPIVGTTLVASVEDSQNELLSKRGSESHNRHIDFQYVVKGCEGFGIIDHYTSKPNCNYDGRRDVIHYNYEVSKMRMFESTPDRFFIFFPRDWHIAKVNTQHTDQHIRVIVIKVDYKD